MRTVLLSRLVVSLAVVLFLSPFVAGAAAPPPLAVSGRVLDDQGAPLAGAEVLLAPAPGPLAAARLELEGRSAPEPVARARSAADGSYRLAVPEVGLYQVRIEAKGRVPVVLSQVPVVEEVELEPARLAGDAGGQVTVVDSAGAPLAGVRVRAIPQPRQRVTWRPAKEWEPAVQWGLTDAAGRMRFARDAHGAYQLAAVAADRPAVVAGEQRQAATKLTLAVGTAREIEIRNGDRSAAGAAIWLAKPRLALAIADEVGRASVALPKGAELALVVSDAGRATLRATVRPQRGEEPDRPQRLVLDPPRRLGGRVVDSETRAPIAGALVYDLRGDGWWTTSDARGYAFDLERGASPLLAAVARGYLAGEGFSGVDPGGVEAPVLALEPAATIEGVVVDGEGRPVAAAEVVAEAQRPVFGGFSGVGEPEARSARSDERGAFRLHRLTASLAWQLSARRAGFGIGRVVVDGLAAGRRRTGVRVVLPPQGQLVGRVLGSDETPVVGARLELVPNATGDFRLRMFRGRTGREESPKTTSGEEGRFAFAGLSAGFHDLIVEASGFAPTRIPRVEVAAGEARDLGEVLLDPGVVVAGRVVDREGAPIGGAEILVEDRYANRRRPATEAAPVAVSGEDGGFEIPDRRHGERIDVLARRTGFGVATQLGIVVPPEQRLRLELPPLGRISGRVLDAQGRPAEASVGGFVVQRVLTGALGAMMRSDEIEPVATDAEGRFELTEVAAGEVSLLARGPAGEHTEKGGLELAPGGVLEGLELRFEAGARVVGRVVDPDGRPAREALVDVEGRAWGQRSALSDGDGRFTMPGLAPGRHTLVADKHPFRRALREVEIGAADNEVQVELQLGAGLSVRGGVVDEQGAPAADAWVTLSSAGTNSGFQVGDFSRSDGGFELRGVEPGRYTVFAQKPGYRRAELPEPVIVEALDVDGVQLRLGRGGAIHGHVLGVTFDDLADVQIVARSAGEIAVAGPDYEGAYRLDGLAPGEWTVVAQVQRSGRRAQGRATLAESQGEVELDLEFGKGLVLSGEVLWRGEPVPAGWVSASGGAAPSPASAMTDGEGRFRLEGLAEGTYQVRASESSGLAWAVEQVELAADREIRLELASARVEGEVRDARDERPIRGAQVRVEPASGEPTAGMRFSINGDGTDADGSYRRDGVALGEQRVLASADGYAAAEQRVTIVDRDQVARVDFRLEPNEGVTVRVLGPAGVPPDRVWAAALDAAGNGVWADYVAPGEGGLLRLTSVPRGEWTLLVGGWNLPVVRRQVSSPGDAGDLVIPPPGALRVRVPALAEGALSTLRLVGADGQPYVYPSGLQPRSDYPMNGRERLLGGLPPGPWRVEVTAADGRRFVADAIVVASGEVVVEIG